MEKDFKPLISFGASVAIMIAAGSFLSSFAISSHNKRRVVERDKCCQWPNDGTPHEGPCIASHYDHRHMSIPIIVNGKEVLVGYGNPLRVRLLCLAHEILWHQLTPPEQLGLTQDQNNRAILSQQEDLALFRQEKGLNR